MYLLLNFVLVVVYSVGGAAVISGLAGRWDLWNVWAYGASTAILFSLQTLWAYRTSPDVLKDRIKPPAGERVGWSSFRAYMLVSVLQWIIAGLDQRLHWSDVVSPAGVVAGLVIVVIGLAVMDWSVAVNPFFSPVTRIQAERGHRVISVGPYATVRHPGYAGLLLWVLASGVALNSLLSIIPIALIVLPVTLYQTVIEDRMLLDELAGYADYAARVRYRLVPGIW